jgi:addiction module HigA family antidote
MGISQYQLAKDLAIPRMRISKIVRGVLGISADTAVRLGKYFDMDPQFWLNLQCHYDLKQVKAKLGKVLDKEVKIRVAA